MSTSFWAKSALPPERAFLRWTLLGSLGSGYIAYAAWAHSRSLPVLCPFRRLTGLRCPFCGMTTATGHMLYGEWRAARKTHLLTPLLWLSVFCWYVWSFQAIIRRCFQKEG
jgi:hypothetical protein